MDTILKPRYLSNTESDSSDEGEDQDKKDSSSSSKVTVVPREGTAKLQTVAGLETEEKEEEDVRCEAGGEGGDKRVVFPTARFLQVNEKKVSSYDLLVRPPKRPRFIIHPSRDNFVSQGSGGSGAGGIFKQKTNPIFVPTSVPQSKTPTLECIYFENEKLKYRKTSGGSWSSSSSSASPRNPGTVPITNPPPPIQQKQQQQPPRRHVPIAPLPRVLSEEHTLRQIELCQENGVNGGGGGGTRFKADRQGPCSTSFDKNKNECSGSKGKEFPTTENYAYYAHWTPSFQLIFKGYENDRLKDENRNFLPNTLSKVNTVHQTEAPVEESPPRQIIQPVYRLRDVSADISNAVERPRPTTVFLKENDYDSTTEISLFLQDERSRNKPPQKKRKFNTPGEYNDEEDYVRRSAVDGGPRCELLYKICNQASRESEILGVGQPETTERNVVAPEPCQFNVNSSQDKVSSIFRTAYHDLSSMYDGPPVRIQTREEFSVLHHPDLRDLRSDSTGMGTPITVGQDGGVILEGLIEEPEEEFEFDDGRPSYSSSHTTIHQSPLGIFLSNSTGVGGHGSGLHFGGGSPFVSFQDGSDPEEEEVEESRIVDVTDLIDDEDDNEVIEIISMTRTAGRPVASEMETIFQAGSTISGRHVVQKDSSGPCQLMEGILKTRTNNGSDEPVPISRASLDPQELEGQEVLMQPNPRLKISKSVHSALERGLDPTSTLTKFVEKRAKSDYFVGKVAGLSKSVMKMYRQQYSDTIHENCDNNGNDDMAALTTTTAEESDAQSSVQSTFEETEEHQVVRKESSLRGQNIVRRLTSGNRISDTGDITTRREMEALRPAVRLQSSSSSSNCKPKNTVMSYKDNYQEEDVSKKPAAPVSKAAPKKSILKREKKPSVFKRIFSCLFKGLVKRKKARTVLNNRENSESIPAVPSVVLKRERCIVQHTDSRELYRERRQKFFKEQKEFQDESLATYVKSILLHDPPQQSSKQLLNSPPPAAAVRDLPTCIPISTFLEKSINFPRDSVQDALNNNPHPNEDTVPIPVRLATSDSALLSHHHHHHPTTGRSGRSSLVLRFPPFVQVLAAAMTRRRSLQDSVNGLEMDKEKLKRPLKGILKKINQNDRRNNN